MKNFTLANLGLISIAFSQSLMASSNFSRVFNTRAPKIVLLTNMPTVRVINRIFGIDLNSFGIAFYSFLVVFVRESFVSKFLFSTVI